MAFKILFMGTPDFAVPILKSVNESKHDVIEVYTQSTKYVCWNSRFFHPVCQAEPFQMFRELNKK